MATNEGPKHTPGPWRWELNEKSKIVQLQGGIPKFDCTVMDFVRYGMGGAAPRFVTKFRPHLNILKRCEEYGVIVPGREHHADWHKTIVHPDARLIAAAPDLLEALNDAVKLLTIVRPLLPAWNEGDEADLNHFRAAIAKALGAKS